jgi:hypothetical protein
MGEFLLSCPGKVCVNDWLSPDQIFLTNMKTNLPDNQLNIVFGIRRLIHRTGCHEFVIESSWSGNELNNTVKFRSFQITRPAPVIPRRCQMTLFKRTDLIR